MSILTEEDFQRAADTLGCEVAAIKAVAEQEGRGKGFDADGRPIILFERHLFHRYTHGRFDETHPGISNAKQGGYGKSAAQYGRFNEAFTLDPNAAMMAASWGMFQILGANFAICGYASVGAFVDAMKESAGKHLDAFCAYVLHTHLDGHLTAHEWAAFARGYNGPNYRENEYDTKIAAAYEKFAAEQPDPSPVVSEAAPAVIAAPTIEQITALDPAIDPPSDLQSQPPPSQPENATKPSLWERALGYQSKVDEAASLKNSLSPLTPSLSPISGQSWVSAVLGKIFAIFLGIWGVIESHPEYTALGVVLFLGVLAYLAVAKGHAVERFKAFWSYKSTENQSQEQKVVVNNA